jgi:hypothetical protein
VLLWVVTCVLIVVAVLAVWQLYRQVTKTGTDLGYFLGESPWFKEVFGSVVILILLLIAVLSEELGWLHALLLWVFSSLTFWFALQLMGAIRKGDLPAFESHWGGFGGGMGGWRLSASMVYLLACLAFALLTIVTASNAVTVEDTTAAGAGAPAETAQPTDTPAP